MQNLIQNEYNPASLKQQNTGVSATAQTAISREAQEVQAMMVISKQFPRDVVRAIDNVLNACMRPKLAETALYSYARGGTNITGPSIRLAEAIAQNWGNIDYGIKELENKSGESQVMAYAWDMETNTRVQKIFSVTHKRYTRKGSYDLEDPRDIYEMVANQGARRLRACILRVIPGDVVEGAVKQCEETLRINFKVTPDVLKQWIEAFKTKGVSKEQLEKLIQRRMDAAEPAHMLKLQNIWNSLKDGMSTVSDWFEIEEEPLEKPSFTDPKKGSEALKGKLAGKAGK